MAISDKAQLGMDERVIVEDTLERLLEDRLRAADARSEVNKVFKDKDAAAKDRIATLGLETGDVVRVGRFRIAKSAVPEKHVEFDTDASSRISISLWEN